MDGLGEWADASAGAPKAIPLFTPARATRSAFCPGKEEKKQNNLYFTVLEGVTNRPRIFELCLHNYSSFWSLICVVCLQNF